MTKKNFNFKQNKKKQNKKNKRFRYHFVKKNLNSKKNFDKTSDKTSTQKGIDKINNKNNFNINIELIKENTNKYARNLIINYFEKYSINIIKKSFLNESKNNKEVITEATLYEYNLTNEHRKMSLKYLLNFIRYHNIDIKCYFFSSLIFDLFLINYSKDEFNNNCKTFFNSKITNRFSETKLIILSLCCYYLSSKYYNSNIFTIDQLLLFENAKEEVTYDELNNLINNIIKYTDLNICNINIYYFIEIFKFDILENIKTITKNKNFSDNFVNFTIHFSTRIVQNIELLNIKDNIQALGIIIFSFNFSKFVSQETNENLDNYLKCWTEKISSEVKNNDKIALQNIFNWLNAYIKLN